MALLLALLSLTLAEGIAGVTAYEGIKLLTWNTYLLDLRLTPPANESVLAMQAQLIAEKVKAESPDVVCFQEVWTPETKESLVKAMAPEYPHYTKSPEFGVDGGFVSGIRKIMGSGSAGGAWKEGTRGSGLVTFTKPHVVIQHEAYRQFVHFGGVDGFWPKGMLGTHLRVETQEGFGYVTVINTHLSTYESYVVSFATEKALHNQQTDQIQAFASELREEAPTEDQAILILGDFNIQSHDHFWSTRIDGTSKYKYLTASGVWVDLWTARTEAGVPLADPNGPNEEWTWCDKSADFSNNTQCGYDAIAAGDADTNLATYNGGRIDYIWEYRDRNSTTLTYKAMRVLAHTNTPDMVSDHRALVLDAEVATTEKNVSGNYSTGDLVLLPDYVATRAYRSMCEGQENQTTGPNANYVAYYINTAAGAGPCLPLARNETDCCRYAPYWSTPQPATPAPTPTSTPSPPSGAGIAAPAALLLLCSAVLVL